jgi:cytidylate kinase
MGIATLPEDVLTDIRARDERDSGRSAAPLVMAPDADLLDTSDLSIEAAVQRAVALAEARLERGAQGGGGKPTA